MAYAKTKNSRKPRVRRSATHSADLHSRKARFLPQYPRTVAQKLIVAVIILAIVAVGVALASTLLSNPERLVRRKLDAMAADYYENHLYAELESSPEYAEITDLDEFMEKYARLGFARVTLRQLLLYDDAKYGAEADYLLNYCDENVTNVTFYPEPPYGRGAYRAEFSYSCAY